VREFLDRFKFRPEYTAFVGVERETFLVNETGLISPLASLVLSKLTDRERYGYELSACQLEDRVGPAKIGDLRSALLSNEAEIVRLEKELGFGRLFTEVGPEEMSLDIYPDPTGRYQEIARNLPKEILAAACRVIGTHVHIGMPDHETALRVYNGVVQYWDELWRMGDGSCGERLSLYKKMAPKWEPQPFNTWHEFYQEAVLDGFATDPRKCWRLIRLSVHGTIEFRMFGATRELNKVVAWARRCLELCQIFLT
jgi:gamma-glutamyl:cysteine ligase YbdK (ATP-grasp superfamily)